MNFIVKSVLAAGILLSAVGANAQCPGCIVQTGSCPSATQDVQLCGNGAFTTTSGDTFSEVVTFALPVSFVIRQGDPFPQIPLPGFTAPFDVNIFIDTITLTSVTGLPAGLSWESDSSANGNRYYSYIYQYGCVNICGDVDCGISGPSNVTLNFSWTATYSTSDPQFQAILGQFLGSGQVTTGSVNVTIGVDPSTNLVLDLSTPSTSTVIDSGETITLEATTGFDTYLWSTGETVETINAAPADTTTYSVTVTDAFGCEQTDNLEVQVLAIEDSIPDDTTGITTIGYNDALMQVYPNPSKGTFTINVANPAMDGIIEVLDITGKRVLVQSLVSANNIITLDNAKGLYIVKVVSGNQAFTRKLLIH